MLDNFFQATPMKHFHTMWSFSKHYTYRKKLQSKNTLGYFGLTSEQNKLECFYFAISSCQSNVWRKTANCEAVKCFMDKPENNC